MLRKLKASATKAKRLNPRRSGSKVRLRKVRGHHDLSDRTNTSRSFQTRAACQRRRKIRRVVIFGKNGCKALPVKVDKKGVLETHSKVNVRVNGLTFRKREYTVEAMDRFLPLPLENISHAINYVYLVRNMGDSDANVYVQIGTDHENLADDLEGIMTIPAHQTTIVTPLRFSEFMRLLYRSANEDQRTKLHIVFQAQILYQSA